MGGGGRVPLPEPVLNSTQLDFFENYFEKSNVNRSWNVQKCNIKLTFWAGAF